MKLGHGVAALLVALTLRSAAAQTRAADSTARPAAPPKKPVAATAPRPKATAPAKPGPGANRLDGIAAVVNEEVVLQSDVEEQLYQFLTQSHAQPDPAALDTLRHQVLDQLINEKIIVAEAKRQGMVASEAEVNRQVDEAVRQKKEALGGEQAFQDQLRTENTTEAAVRERYRQQLQREMLAQRLIHKALPPKPVSPEEAAAYFKLHPDKFPKRPPDVHVQVIQIPVLPDSAADAQGRAAALAARKRIVAGEKFAKVAADVSQDPGSARAGGDLGFISPGTMEPSFEQAALKLKIGELSQPIKSPFGWHLIEVLERDTVRTKAGVDSLDEKGKPVPEVHARHILIRVPVGDDDVERARKLAVRVRAEAVKGMDFATLVHRYSKYQGQQDENGDLGFISLGTLQPQIRAGLDTLEAGEVSEVLQNPVGFNIFKLLDRRPERVYSYEEIKDELPNAVAEIRFRERYDDWVKGLRAKARVEMRDS